MSLSFFYYTNPFCAPRHVGATGFALRALALILCCASAPAVRADAAPDAHATDRPERIVISGAVPDEATRTALLARLRDVYGSERVDDRISVGGVTAPSDWSALVPKLFTQQLKSVSRGQLTVDGTAISLRGEVGSESLRRKVLDDFARSLNPAYVIRNGLRVTATGQAALDRALADRIIEFEAGSALLTESGKRILDDMAEVLKGFDATGFEVIGHTDDSGTPARNLALSRARASSVKTYLTAKGIKPELIGSSGMGADQPIASNATDVGRKRNRRIEFRASQ